MVSISGYFKMEYTWWARGDEDVREVAESPNPAEIKEA
jgi:hypothetical protein